MTPTARSLQWFRKMGIAAGVVERRLPKCFTTVDLLGFIDMVACIPATEGSFRFSEEGVDVYQADAGHILGVQVTSDGNLSARVRKIVEDCPHARDWLESGGRIVVHGWGKKGAAGKRKLWTLRTVPVTLADLDGLGK